MKSFEKKRMLKLADFLDKLPRQKFYFGSVVDGPDIPRKELDCRSTACAIGWCPVVFPSLCEYGSVDDWYPIRMKGNHYGSDFTDIAKSLFGITYVEAVSLFAPNEKNHGGLKTLSEKATAKQVAANLRKFIAIKERK